MGESCPFFNHSELRHVNCLAKSVGCDHPFLAAEMLPPDKGECFFSQHVRETLPSLKSIKPGPLGECMCMTCTATTTATATRQEMELNNEANHEVNNNNTQIVFATATTATPTTKKTRKKQNNKHSARSPTVSIALCRRLLAILRCITCPNWHQCSIKSHCAVFLKCQCCVAKSMPNGCDFANGDRHTIRFAKTDRSTVTKQR